MLDIGILDAQKIVLYEVSLMANIDNNERKIKMKKALAFILALVMVFALCACGNSAAPAATPAPAEAAPAKEAPVEKTALSLATVCAAGTPTDLTCLKFQQMLNDSGLFDITYYGQSQYGSVADMMENILADDNLIAIASPADVGDTVGVGDLSAMMAPFLCNYPEEIRAITESDWFAGLADQCYAKNIKIINCDFIEGTRYFWTTKQVVEPSDMAGLKFRVPGSANYVNTFTAFGATPVTIAVADLYTALQNGTADAFEFPLADAYAYKLNEVSKYVANQNYVTGFTGLMMSATVWESLSAEQQAVINDAAKECADYCFEVFAEKTEEAKGLLVDAGIEFYDVNVDAYRACVDEYFNLSPFSEGTQETLDNLMADYRANH